MNPWLQLPALYWDKKHNVVKVKETEDSPYTEDTFKIGEENPVTYLRSTDRYAIFRPSGFSYRLVLTR